jgi:hypothetical protein
MQGTSGQVAGRWKELRDGYEYIPNPMKNRLDTSILNRLINKVTV